MKKISGAGGIKSWSMAQSHERDGANRFQLPTKISKDMIYDHLERLS
jgi:dihydroorotate dehydrogenase